MNSINWESARHAGTNPTLICQIKPIQRLSEQNERHLCSSWLMQSVRH